MLSEGRAWGWRGLRLGPGTRLSLYTDRLINLLSNPVR